MQNKIKSILRNSRKLRFLSVDKLFPEKYKPVAFEEFLKQRENANIDIEEIIFKERYNNAK